MTGTLKKIFLAACLLVTAIAPALAMEHGDARRYTEQGYFSVEIPTGWEKDLKVFGLSPDEKKVYGADFLSAKGSGELVSRISVHFFARGNRVHKDAEQYIALHARPIGGAVDGETYGPVKEGRVGSRTAKIFDRTTFFYFPPETINPKKIPVYEKFAVVPAKQGFYVLRLYSPQETAEANLKAYASVLASFNPLAR